MVELDERAKILSEALPYILKYKDQIIVIKYGFGVLILDSKTPRNKKQIYEVQLENYLITDEWARALIKRACHQKNNAFVVIKNQFYVHNLNINLPDDYTVDIE